MLMNPAVYAKLLGEKIDKHNTEVYLVNTGWLSGGYGKGDRINLPYTRAMIREALNGKFKNIEFVEHPVFKIMMPKECPGVPKEMLDPKNTWTDKEAYDAAAKELALKFNENFKKFGSVSEDIVKAGPEVRRFTCI